MNVWRRNSKKKAGAASALPQAKGRKIREVLTPEGVKLRLALADRGERASALLLDLLIILAAHIILVLFILLMIYMDLIDSDTAFYNTATLWILVSFLIRSFYFSFFEIRWHGMTPGKKILGIRVVDRQGGRLTSDAIFARNLLREVELFLPISLLLSSGSLTIEYRISELFIWIWLGIFFLMPLFNKDNLRAGDIVGGTWVVESPKLQLLSDLAQAQKTREETRGLIGFPNSVGDDSAGSAASPYRFTREQLEAYGIYELQTLENVLRNKHHKSLETKQAVYDKISRKIGWSSSSDRKNPTAFLEAYYTALRAHLEKRMLFGVRRKDKHHKV